jgi:photosystem II stability/assembly factor-like uncharacterized protein
MIRSLTVFLLFAVVLTSMGQSLNMDKLKGMKPRSIGPAGMSGRITAIDAVVSNPDIIYAGSASGGLWKSTSGGIDWEPIFDKENVMSIGAIAIQQDNPSVIWVGTGEGNPRNSLNGGYGLYKSLDAGKTWKMIGLEKTRHIHRILIDQKNPNTVYIGAIGSPWGDHPERGVYKTEDGGQTFKQILFVDNKTGVGEMVMDPINPNKLFVSMWEHRRQPWTFKSGGPSSGLHVTYDGGKTWKKLTSKEGLPEGELGRMGLAIAKSKPDVIYALIEAKKNALYRSDDGGEKWEKVNDKPEIGDRPFYYFEIYTDPKNENRLYTIFSGINISEDGGKSFRSLVGSGFGGVHPDHHAFWINPNNPNMIVEGNDGGLNITYDMGKSWRFAENIPVGQFYHVNVDMEQPYNVYGGMQDNGSWVGPAYVWRNGGVRNSYFQEVAFGDGFDVSPDPADSRYGYAMSQGGALSRFDKQTGYAQSIRPTHPDANMRLRFNWNAGFTQDPFDAGTIYYGSQFLHKSIDRGKTWQIISPDLTSNDPEKQKQGDSGGLTMDATGAENHCTILAISVSPLDKDVIWVGTDDGRVQLSRDGGKTWTDTSPKIAGMPKNSWVPQLRASTFNKGEAFVVVNNYRQFDYKPYAFRTRDFGVTWESLVSPAQVGENNYTLALQQDLVEPKLFFLGTENGLWVSLDDSKTWTRWTSGYPAGVPTMDIVIHPREHDLVLGTFGRAFYVLDDIRPLRELVKTNGSALNETLKIFQPADAYQVYTQQPSGIRFDADAMFNGQNRPTGALISLVINKPEDLPAGQAGKKEEPKPVVTDKKNDKAKTNEKPAATASTEKKPEASKAKTDSVKIEVVNSSGAVIQTIRQKTPDDNGLTRVTWNLRERGETQPNRGQAGGGGGGFGGGGFGPTVLPGTYKLRVLFAGKKDSTMVTVKTDPRFNFAPTDVEARYNQLKELQKLTKVTGEAVKRLKESIAIVEDYEKKIKDLKRADLKDAETKTKAMKDSLTNVMDYIFGKEDKRQGITRNNDSRLSFIGRANGFIGSATGPINETDKRVFSQAEGKVGEILNRVNSFYDGSWKTYRMEMEKINLSLFKDYQPLKRN